ncbi:hypothetical protein GCM10010912_34940 [Paenibacillus albidus]|uniref:Uncharacterized protein n=1 Tax=Paenibacillus albidus TaxID=2041023 RepID=A0A917CH40_9BACL|nr:hypothetical protein GCM10010912_34940 [Paenibacillus albidus]
MAAVGFLKPEAILSSITADVWFGEHSYHYRRQQRKSGEIYGDIPADPLGGSGRISATIYSGVFV